MQVAVGGTENVGLDVRLRVDVYERDLDAVSVRVDAWIQRCVEVRVTVYVFVGAVECEGLEVGTRVDVDVRLRIDVIERVRVDVIEQHIV